MKRIKRDDEVLVVAGKDRGKKGTVLSVHGDRVLVKGINQVLKHRKPDPDKNIYGGRYELEKTIHISNVSLFDEGSTPSKVGFLLSDEGIKSRVLKKTGKTLA